MLQNFLLLTHYPEFSLRGCWEFCSLLAGRWLPQPLSPIATVEWESGVDGYPALRAKGSQASGVASQLLPQPGARLAVSPGGSSSSTIVQIPMFRKLCVTLLPLLCSILMSVHKELGARTDPSLPGILGS